MIEEQTQTVYEVWEEEVNPEVIKAGYIFVSDGTWYARGTEAVLLYTLANGRDEVKNIEDFIAGGNDPSGIFGGWCEKDSTKSGNADNVNYRDGWDSESCGLSEFNIYKNGKLVKQATSMTDDDWKKDKQVKEYATWVALKQSSEKE